MQGDNISVLDSNLLPENGFLNFLQSDLDLDLCIEQYLLSDSNQDFEFELKNSAFTNINEEYEKIAGILDYLQGSEAEFQRELEASTPHCDSEDETSRETHTELKKSLPPGGKKRCASSEIDPAAHKPKRRKQDPTAEIPLHHGSPTAAPCFSELLPQTPPVIPPGGSLLSQVPVIPLGNCLSVDSIQQIFNLRLKPGTNIIICTASPPTLTQAEEAPVLPSALSGVSASPSTTSIPASQDRSASSSPFAPTEADLPNLPEETSVHQCVTPEKALCGQQSPVPAESLQKKEKYKHVDQYKAELMELYEKSLVTGPNEPYVDISLVKSRIDTKSRKAASKIAEKELVIYDLAEKEQETIGIHNIFDDKERKKMETKIIALLGSSGMGKTLLIRKICQEWSNGKFSEFSLVFYFDSSRLNSTKRHCTLKELLFDLSLASPKEKSAEIFQYILRNPEKVLLIFDGLDEFQDCYVLLQSSLNVLPTKPHSTMELFWGLFQKKLLRGCTMLITARPREKFNQYWAKVDQIIETIGFSPQQVEWFIQEYFKALPNFSNALKWIQRHQYLFSYCFNPLICKLMCMFTESNLENGNLDLNLRLATIFQNVLKDKQATVASNTPSLQSCTKDRTNMVPEHQHYLTDHQSLSTMELNHSWGLQLNDCQNAVSSGTLVQYFHLAQNQMKSLKDKHLVKYISLHKKRKRTLEICPAVVRRFLMGLLYQKETNLPPNILKVVRKKQKKMSDYFHKVPLGEFSLQKLLELCHCVYEIREPCLTSHVAVKLSNELTFVGTRLTPPDVHVLKHVLQKANANISLDLQKTGIDQEGLKELVELRTVGSFRASLSDTVRLWKTLHKDGDYHRLKLCIKKFTMDPFKAESMKDIRDLSALVDIQHDVCTCSEASGDVITGIPAIHKLQKIIFGLGKRHGQEGFMVLVDILPKFPSLRYLDLHNLTENHIGDKGVHKMAEIFPELPSLETLDLSQNNITDAGAQKLAASLPRLRSLQTLSLYNNYVRDAGAEDLAETLPKMSSLEKLHLECNEITYNGAQKLTESLRKCPKMKSLMLYSKLIPHVLLQHLQKLDSRISCLSIG